MEIARSNGTYELRVSGNAAPAEAQTAPLARVPLKQGDPVGFDRTMDGELVAIAGDRRIALAQGRYAWFEPYFAPSPAERAAGGVMQFAIGIASIPLAPIYLAIAVVFPDILPRC